MHKMRWREIELLITGTLPPEAIEAITPSIEQRARQNIAKERPGQTITSLNLDTVEQRDPVIGDEPPIALFTFDVVLD